MFVKEFCLTWSNLLGFTILFEYFGSKNCFLLMRFLTKFWRTFFLLCLAIIFFINYGGDFFTFLIHIWRALTLFLSGFFDFGFKKSKLLIFFSIFCINFTWGGVFSTNFVLLVEFLHWKQFLLCWVDLDIFNSHFWWPFNLKIGVMQNA